MKTFFFLNKMSKSIKISIFIAHSCCLDAKTGNLYADVSSDAAGRSTNIHSGQQKKTKFVYLTKLI